MDSSSSSSRKVVPLEPLDKFTLIPEELWRHISSFLSLKDAVRTSRLSKKWREIWNSNPNLIFDFIQFPEMENIEEKFIEFIEQTLARHDASDIERFELHLLLVDEYDASSLNEWINFAVSHNVKHFFLAGYMDEFHMFPDCLFAGEYLVKLELILPYFVLKLPENVSLPNLLELRLKELTISEHTNDVLITSCPSLEFLSIIACDLTLLKTFTITASRLKSLILFGCDGIESCCLKLETPMLMKFSFLDNIACDFECLSMPSFSLGFVAFEEPFPEERSRDEMSRAAFKLFKYLRNTNILVINQWFIEFLSWVPDLLDKLENTSLENLESITLYMWPTKNHISIMMLILGRCPNLCELEIIISKVSEAMSPDLPCLDYQSQNWRFEGILLNHLANISIFGFEGKENDWEILKFLVEKSPILIELLAFKANNHTDSEDLCQFDIEMNKKISIFKILSQKITIRFL